MPSAAEAETALTAHILSTPPTGETVFSPSRLIALLMWHGGFEQGATAQQQIFWGMNQALAKKGYHGLFLDLGGDMSDADQIAHREAARLRETLRHAFGGVIFYPYAYASNRELIQEVGRRVPLILVDRMVPGIQTDFIGVDNRTAMYEATRHLIEQGHQRIAYVSRAEPINTVQDRLEGYRLALREHPAAPLPEMILTTTASTEDAWHKTPWAMFDMLFRLPDEERPTAVCCVNDYVALHVAERLTAVGLRIPQDVALVGFDNIVQVLPDGTGLTTVAQPFEEIGQAAADALLCRLSSPDLPPVHRELPTRLIVRGSSDISARTVHYGSNLVQKPLDADTKV
jgi:DNA-binding LacI/PurR family transcriptional regulator